MHRMRGCRRRGGAAAVWTLPHVPGVRQHGAQQQPALSNRQETNRFDGVHL